MNRHKTLWPMTLFFLFILNWQFDYRIHGYSEISQLIESCTYIAFVFFIAEVLTQKKSTLNKPYQWLVAVFSFSLCLFLFIALESKNALLGIIFLLINVFLKELVYRISKND